MDRTEPAGIDPFEFIEPALASADIAVVNAEMAISDRGAPLDKQYVFRAPPAAADRMAAAGIDVANLANNHAKDYGPDALEHTVELLQAAGVVALGAGPDDFEAYRYRVLDTAGGVRVAFVGVSMIVPRGFPAGPASAGIASARPPQPVLDSVWGAAGVAEVVVAVVHWGVERTTCPNAAQRDFARSLLDAGATAVIGHHPHVLQPVEFSGGKLVAYSLGNFVWHPRWGITGETGVLEVAFDGDRIVDWTFTLICSTRTAPLCRSPKAPGTSGSPTSSRGTARRTSRHRRPRRRRPRPLWRTPAPRPPNPPPRRRPRPPLSRSPTPRWLPAVENRTASGQPRRASCPGGRKMSAVGAVALQEHLLRLPAGKAVRIESVPGALERMM